MIFLNEHYTPISSGFIGYLVVPDGLSHGIDVNKSPVAGG